MKESDVSEEAYMKLKNSESRLADLKSSMKTLGKEATKAMLEVDNQQQSVTYQRLRTLVKSPLDDCLFYWLVPGLDMKMKFTNCRLKLRYHIIAMLLISLISYILRSVTLSLYDKLLEIMNRTY